MADSEQSLAIKTVTKLLLSAEHYASVSPVLARFYMLEAEHLKKKLHLPASSPSQICSFCCVIRRPDNCTQRLLSKMNAGQQIQRLERKIAGGRTVGKFAKSLLDLHSARANRLQIHCHHCKKRTLVQGACRPAKASKASDVHASKNCQAQVLKKRNKKRQTDRIVDSNTKATSVLFAAREIEHKSLEKRPHQTPSHPESQEKRKVTNKKETLKQKHNMLQNILKQKTNIASPDTSTALKSFLLSL